MQRAANHPTAITAKLRRQLERQLWEAAKTLAERHEELGRRIKLARDEKGWKQKELAAAVHVEPTTVSRWETGRHAPDVATLRLIAQELGKPTTFFVTEQTDEHGGPNLNELAHLVRRVEGLEDSMEDVLRMLRSLVGESGESEPG